MPRPKNAVAKVRITAAAKAHLLDIWAYTEAAWGASQADAYLKDIGAAFDRLAHTPHLGKARPEIHNDYRSLPVKSHVIFYTVTNSATNSVTFVNIIGVLHAKMDVAGRI